MQYKNTIVSDHILLIALALSGFSGLGYEIIWTKLLSLSLGSESIAVYGILSGYFGGMSLGAFLFHRKVKSIRRPILWYVTFECIIAGYAILLPLLLAKLSILLPNILLGTVGENASFFSLLISLIVAGGILLPATVLLGASFPAIIEARKRDLQTATYAPGLGRLYAANTGGATCGIFFTVYYLLGHYGMVAGSFILAFGSILAALAAYFWAVQNRHTMPSQVNKTNKTKATLVYQPKEKIALLFLIMGTGFASISFEVVGIQILTQIFRNTIYTFANVLGIFLIGTSGGAWFYSIYIKKTRYSFNIILGFLLAGLTISVLFSGIFLANSLSLLNLFAPLSETSFARHLFGEMVISCFVFLIPTICMGALFSHLIARFTDEGIGTAVALNTLGATIAPLIFALVFIDKIGYTGSFFLVALIYAVLFLVGLYQWQYRFKLAAVYIGSILILGLIIPKNMIITDQQRKQLVLKQYESLMGVVRVVQEKTTAPHLSGKRYLQLDRFYQMGGGNVIEEKRLGFLPLLLSQRQGSILYCGVGTGIFVDAARYFDFHTIDAVEIVPAIFQALEYFDAMNNRLRKAENVHLICSDARRYISATRKNYNIILADLFHPARPGASFLFTVEHFKTIKARLTNNGLFIQFIPLYQYDVNTLKTVLRTFQFVFPQCHAWLGRTEIRNVMVLIGLKNQDQELTVSLRQAQNKIAQTKEVQPAISGIVDLFSYYLFDPKSVKNFAGIGPLNKDLSPRIMFDVPRMTYESVPAERLASLSAVLQHRILYPKEMITDVSEENAHIFRQETKGYAQALASFLQAELLATTRITDNNKLAEIVELYVNAYEQNSIFGLRYEIPFRLSPYFDQFHEKIFPRLIKASPQQQWLYIDYLNFLRYRLRDEKLFEEFYREAIPVFGSTDTLNSILQRSATMQ